MTYVQGVDLYKNIPANYNAVKIQINDPTTSIPEGFRPSQDDNGTYNAVNIEVNRPKVDVRKNESAIYNYPQNNDIVPFNTAVVQPQNLPQLPAPMYQTFINNKTLVNAEFEFESSKKNKSENKEIEKFVESDIDDEIDEIDDSNEASLLEPVVTEVITAEVIEVPAPDFIEITDIKSTEPNSEVAFHGINFKANENKVEIVPSVDIKPEVDVAKVLDNLSDKDYDKQALQMEEIARISMEDSEKAIPYIVTEIFSELINIVKADTTELTPPNEKQIDIRKKIIINEIVKEQAQADGQDIEKLGLPYQLSDDEIQIATTLTDLEQAERNKEYALYTMAILSKVYAEHVEKQTGNIVPLTDLPGASSIVDTLRYSDNSGVKIAAIDALRYIHRPEYNDEIKSILTLAAQDKDPYAARNAAITLVALEEQEFSSQKNNV